jgi:hypothetical protein
MITLGELFDALSELSQVTTIVQEAQASISRGGDPRLIDRKQTELWRAHEHMTELRDMPLSEMHHNHQLKLNLQKR